MKIVWDFEGVKKLELKSAAKQEIRLIVVLL